MKEIAKLKSQIVCLLIVTSIFATSCIFKPTPFRGVISYRHGRVYIKHDRFYRVGELPAGWERMETRARTISFYNPHLKSSISTDAFCGRPIGEQKLESLGGEIITAVENRSTLSNTQFMLDGRGAVRNKVKGKMDGVPVVVDLVVTKKDGCAFDFYAVMPPDDNAEAVEAFETFLNGFHYSK